MRNGFWLALALLAIGQPTRAGLPAESWPQVRRDAARSGLAAEPIPATRVRRHWTATTSGALTGEPAVAGCTVVVVDERGVVHARNARSGEPLWTHERTWAVSPYGIASAPAFDDEGRLHVGLPADPLIARSWSALVLLHTALESHAIDLNVFPVGPDLDAALTPTYIVTLPPNPITGSEMVYSASPSPGDYIYRQEASGAGFHLAIWNTDGAVLDLGRESCGGGVLGGPAPDWPLSPERGGTATTLQVGDGALVHQDVAGAASVVLVPGIAAGGVDWYSLGEGPAGVTGWRWLDWTAHLARTGRFTHADRDGLALWSSSAWGAARGGAARTTDDRILLARGPDNSAGTFMHQARVLSTGVESYSIDNNQYPPPGELRDDLIPIYLRCIPPNAFSGQAMVHSDTPSPGDYRWTVSADRLEYAIEIWGARGDIALRMETGTFTQVAEDLPAALELLAPDGSSLWLAELAPDAAADASPPLILSDEAAVVGTSRGDLWALELADGSERWRASASGTLSLPPAARPEGGVVVVTDAGLVEAFTASGSSDWSWWVGAPVAAAPVTGSDGGVLVADLDGRLTALNGDGSLRWISYLGGPTRASLTTAPILSGGWIFVGRSDGVLVAAVQEDTGGRPPDPSLLLATGLKSRSSVEFEWSGAEPVVAPGAHWHFLRWRDSLWGRGERLLRDHPSTVQSFLDEDAGGELLFYDLHAVDCGENASGLEVR